MERLELVLVDGPHDGKTGYVQGPSVVEAPAVYASAEGTLVHLATDVESWFAPMTHVVYRRTGVSLKGRAIYRYDPR